LFAGLQPFKNISENKIKETEHKQMNKPVKQAKGPNAASVSLALAHMIDCLTRNNREHNQ